MIRAYLRRAAAGVAGFLALACFAGAAEPAPVRVPRAAKAPVLDGKLDDACWKANAWQSGFTRAGQPSELAEVQTRFQFCHDGDRLYFAARMEEPRMEALRAEVAGRDGKVWLDDCVEIFLDPEGKGGNYRHFAINAAGAVFDAYRDQGGHVGDPAWDSGAKAAAGRGKDHWTIECAIPFADLEMTRAGARMEFNVGRERKAAEGGEQISTFAPLPAAHFHKTGFFVPLELVDADLKHFAVDLARPQNPRVVLDGEQVVVLADSHFANRTGSYEFFTVTASVEKEGRLLGSEARPLALDHGAERPLALRVPLDAKEAEGRASIAVTVARRGAESTPVARRWLFASVDYSPISIHLTAPAYRDCIFATENLEEVQGVARIHLSEAGLRGATLRLALEAPGREPVRREISLLKAETPFAFPAKDLPVGDLRVAAELVGADGRPIGRLSHRLRKLPPHVGEARLAADKTLLVDGKPFLPFGWFSVPPSIRPYGGLRFDGQFAKAAANGLNAIVDYDFSFYPVEDLRTYLDEAHRHGIKVAIHPHPHRAMIDPEPSKRLPTEAEAREIREHVRRWRDHPALLGWYMADEPEGVPSLPGNFETIRRIVLEEDPFHPCILLNNTIEGMHRYAVGTDVLMPDPYPLFQERQLAARGLTYYADFIREIAKVDGGRCAAWVTPEGFNYGDFGQADGRAPRFHELRCMWHLAVIHGATGALWYSWWHTQPYPEITEGVAWLAKETQALQPAILAKASSREVKVEPNHAPVHAALRTVGKDLYLFAANTSDKTLTVSLPLPQGAPSRWHVVSEDGRCIEARQGKITDRFGPCDTHVYTTSATVAQRESLKAAAERIAAAKKARLATGNHALLDTGATAQTSSTSVSYMAASATMGGKFANDGSLMGTSWRCQSPPKYPEWWSVTFPAPRTIGRVVAYGTGITSAEVQARSTNDWTTIARLAKDPGHPLRFTAEFAPVQAKALRILVTQGPAEGMSLLEVEAFSPEPRAPRLPPSR
ncbi:MAG: discoidin domain-containing protein [Verrucomicrobiae bacterium]|nr:discoidin domain-containing protein [Verrucomicrobiae bacterium]